MSDREKIIAVTNRHLCNNFMEQINIICEHRPQAIILREKDLSEDDYISIACKVSDVCKRYNVPIILHTFINSGPVLGINRIHIPLALLKSLAGDPSGKEKLKFYTTIGTSVHSVKDAIEAELLGATYVSAGHIYATDCKKGLPPRGLDFLNKVCCSISIPVYAIGGIKLNSAQTDEVIKNGAAGACIMSDFMRISKDSLL